MTGQELVVGVVLFAAVSYLVVRMRSRRRRTCAGCGPSRPSSQGDGRVHLPVVRDP